MSIEGTVGGSETGPTVDANGVTLTGQVRDPANWDTIVTPGDQVKVVHMDDPNLQQYLGVVGECEWVQDTFPFSQVFLVFSDPTLTPLSTFSAWVQKV